MKPFSDGNRLLLKPLATRKYGFNSKQILNSNLLDM